MKFDRLNRFNSNNVVSAQETDTKSLRFNKPLTVISEGLQDNNSPRNAEYWKKYCGVIDKTYVSSLSDYDKEKITKEKERLIAGGFDTEYATLLSASGYDTDKHKFNKDYKYLIHLFLPEKRGLITYHSKTYCTNLNEFAEQKYEIQEQILSLTNSLRDKNNNFSKENGAFITDYINLLYEENGTVDGLDKLCLLAEKIKNKNGVVELKFFNVKNIKDVLTFSNDILSLYSFPEEKREEIFNKTKQFRKQYGNYVQYGLFFKSAFNEQGDFIKEREPIIKEFLEHNFYILPNVIESAQKYPALKEELFKHNLRFFETVEAELLPFLDENGELPQDVKEKVEKFVALSPNYKDIRGFKSLYLECQDKENPNNFNNELFEQVTKIIIRPDFFNNIYNFTAQDFISLVKNETNLADYPFNKKMKIQSLFTKLLNQNNGEYEFLRPITERIEQDLNFHDISAPISKETQIDFIKNVLKNDKTPNTSSTFESTMVASIPTLKEYKNGLPLNYSRNEFLKDLQKICEKNPQAEKIITEELQINIIKDENNNFTGYDDILVLNSFKKSDELREKIYDCCHKFLYENEIKTNNNELNKQVNTIIKAFPEFINIIGKKQHGTHHYSLDIHSLLVLAESINNPLYKKLEDAEKILIKMSTILHDLSKQEGVVDKSHPYTSAKYSKSITNKIIPNPNWSDRIHDIILNHHFLEELSRNKTDAAIRKMAFVFRRPNDFEVAKIIAEADLKAVNDNFYNTYKGALSDDSITNIQKHIDKLNGSGNFIATTQVVNKSKIAKTKINGKEYPIINLHKIADDEDVHKLGFEKGLKKKDLRFLVHMTKNFGTLIWLTQKTNNGLLSESLISPQYNRTYRNQQFGVFLSQKNYNLMNMKDSNQGSGVAKDFNDCVNIIFDDCYRTNCRTEFFKLLGILNTEENKKSYAEFYKENLANLNSLSEIKKEKEYSLCGKKISGEKLKKVISSLQDKLIDKKEKTHNELIGYLPKIEGLIAKVDNEKDIPQELLSLSEKYNYPIIMI